MANTTTAWADLGTAAHVGGVVGVVFDVVSIPVNLAVMLKVSYDIQQYKTKGKSNSAVAKRIGELIKQLDDHCDLLTAEYSKTNKENFGENE